MAEKLRQQQVLPILEVRVLDTVRKRSFRVKRLTEVPVVHTLDEMNKILQKLFARHQSCGELPIWLCP